MSRSTNILIVIIASLVVIAACILNIAGLFGSLRYGTTAEWADLFKWNDSSFINTYTTIDTNYIGDKQGEITGTISRTVDTSTYIPSNGEATYLAKGTDVYSIKGFDPSSFLAVDDGGDYFLYSTAPDSVPDELIEKCGAKAYKVPVDFVYVSIPTVSETADDRIVRIKILDSVSDFKSYVDRYSGEFRKPDGTYTYEQAVDDRGYGEAFFKKKKIIAIYVPEESGSIVYSVSSLMADNSKMTLVLKKAVLPAGIKYDSSATRHMFLEIDAEEYSDQKLAYQIEPTVIPNQEILSGVSASEAMRATVKVAFSLDDLLTTKYEPLVKGVYTREFFDRNMLIIVECSDAVGQSRYSLNSVVNESGFIKVNIDRETDPEAIPDTRMQYITVELAKSEYHDELVIPMTPGLDPDEEALPGVTDLPQTEPPVTDDDPAVTDDEPNVPADPDDPDNIPDDPDDIPEEPVVRVPVDYYPRDLLVVEDIETIAELAGVYSVREELYGEEFFENYILLFVGDTVSSESVEYRYNACEKTEEGIVITVDQTIPEKCVDRPACKYIAIPYLRSEYNGETLKAMINTIYESELAANDNDGQLGY